MNIKQLQYFCRVVEAGSASQAAKTLLLAPTAISMQITALEKELNGTLFNRSSRPMTLTKLGEFVYHRAQEVIFGFEKLERDVWQHVNAKSTTLTLGSVRSVMFNLLPEAIKNFSESHGHIDINLKEVLSAYQPELLINHIIDIGFIRKMNNDNILDEGLRHELILVDPLVAAIPKNHYLSRKKFITLRDFCNSPFIVFPNDQKSGFSGKLFEKFKEHGIVPAISHHALEIHTALALVGAGLGVTLVGKMTIPNNRQDIVFLPIEDFRCLCCIYAVYNPKNNNPYIAMFIEQLKKLTT